MQKVRKASYTSADRVTIGTNLRQCKKRPKFDNLTPREAPAIMTMAGASQLRMVCYFVKRPARYCRRSKGIEV